VLSAIGRGLGGYMLDIDLELPLRLTATIYSLSLTYLFLVFKFFNYENLYKKNNMSLRY